MSFEVTYYEDRRGREPVAQYVERLVKNGEFTAVAIIERMIDLLEEFGPDLGPPQSWKIGEMYELRPGRHRIAYVELDGEIVLLHAWRKTTRKLSPLEWARASSNLAYWKEQ